MKKLYLTDKENLYKRLDDILNRLLHVPFEIKRTENGKPYIEGNPLFFSIAHSGERALIAVCDKSVGVDLELFKEKKHSAVLESLPANERAEIISDKDFLFHWTAREAFIKMRGGTLAADLKHIEFIGGKIYFYGVEQQCKVVRHNLDFGVAAVCVENACKPDKEPI